MSLVSAPFGISVANNEIGQTRARPYTVATGYATAMYYGDPVKLATDGTLNISAGNDDIVGIFAGCEYIDASGKPTISKHWPASTAATNIVAWVYDNVDNECLVQVTANASGFVQTVIGDQVNIDLTATGSAITGNSLASVSAAAVGSGVQGQWRIVGFADGVYHATNNPFPILRVKLARSQFVAVKVAI